MFTITQGHMTLWLMKRGPKFIQRKLDIEPSDKLWKPKPFDINSIIPKVDHQKVEWRKKSRAGKSLRYPIKQTRHDYHNAIVLLQLKLKRGENLVSALADLATDTSPNSKNRANIARRWLRRVIHNRMKPLYAAMPSLERFVKTGKIS